MKHPVIESPSQPRVTGEFVDLEGRRCYRIGAYDAMEPFFMSVVSSSDHWMFVSSSGGLTAGRREPDNALFPYYTDDRIHDASDTTGAVTLIRAVRDGRAALWEPFSSRQDGLYRRSRALYKSVQGDRLVFEEINHDLGLEFRYSWSTSERYGFVRHAHLRNTGDTAVDVALLDGIRNVLPALISRRFQLEYSTLVDGYKRTELADGSRLALFRLSSVPVDNAEPSEALRVNTAWATGLAEFEVVLSTVQCDAFRRGEAVEPESDVCGRRGAYLVSTSLSLAPGESGDWLIVADVEKDAAGVRTVLAESRETDARERVLADVDRGTQELVRVVGRADGLQATASEASVWRHFANALFNVMRGGIPVDGYSVSRDDLELFLGRSNAPVAARHAEFLRALPDHIGRDELIALVAPVGDVDLERLTAEYLPLTFSRRHGDPSRPWNTFAIRLKDQQGNPTLNYQGNWRDIFQNWEALAVSYPDLVESMLFKFADSSTLDGYNPYRVLREGFEWEVLDPDDDWAYIGYWGDHQVIYLERLLEAAERFRPGSVAALLTRKVFTFADVPYRIRPYADLLRNPRDTIDFDHEVEAAALARAARIGSDGKAACGPDGSLVRANFAEKLLIVALSKLSNFVPGAGIWLNTQRPEWNDANNALVGNGVSMVTLYYLRRYLAFLDAQFAASGLDRVELSDAVADLLDAASDALKEHPVVPGVAVSNAERKAVLDRLGTAGERYRTQVYDPMSRATSRPVPVAAVRELIAAALEHADHSIAQNRRADGLYHSYTIMKVSDAGIAVSHLDPMLEGQVAVLSAGVLGPHEVADLLDSLRSSALYREDQNSYLLYPFRDLPHFLDKNLVPPAGAAESELLTSMLDRGDTRLVTRDATGEVHFNADFRNARSLGEALDSLAGTEYGAVAEAERRLVLDLYEQVFEHASFTGRSGTFYKYEGLGSIYWHMVSKLLLSVDEALLGALRDGADSAVIGRLRDHYEQIRAGIGADKSPAAYGAVPTDPYSHTPGFAGVQQPGMTGQVKEDLITRMSEMGVVIERGRIDFLPSRVRQVELLEEPSSLTFVDVRGEVRTIDVPAGAMAFTVCQVPVVLHGAGPASIGIVLDGEATLVDGLGLSAQTSAQIFDRTGEVERLDVFLGLTG
ncbi:hypothetical protein [Demequina sp.]|uniref:hypothetical protein n=1 Tax=Demequina sp. TaxID=2050685 RepID=UPI0025EB91ED|nr:hypothetical protein [Demequina sp.]